jgi:hypothetical protein
MKEYKRGMYKTIGNYKDRSTGYFETNDILIYWPLFKMSLLGVLVFVLSTYGLTTFQIALVSFLTTWFYRDVIARLTGLKKIKAMDMQCLMSRKVAFANVMCVAQMKTSVSRETLIFNYQRAIKQLKKLSYCLENRFGDYYYKELPYDEVVENCFVEVKGLSCQEDIDRFVQDNINVKLPKDGPLWITYYQESYIVDGKEGSLNMTKQNHALCDGISNMCMTLLISADYGKEYFVPIKEPSFIEVWAVKLSVFFMLPSLFMASAFTQADDNILTRRKSKMTGIMNSSSSKKFDFL